MGEERAQPRNRPSLVDCWRCQGGVPNRTRPLFQSARGDGTVFCLFTCFMYFACQTNGRLLNHVDNNLSLFFRKLVICSLTSTGCNWQSMTTKAFDLDHSKTYIWLKQTESLLPRGGPRRRKTEAEAVSETADCSTSRCRRQAKGRPRVTTTAHSLALHSA